MGLGITRAVTLVVIARATSDREKAQVKPLVHRTDDCVETLR